MDPVRPIALEEILAARVPMADTIVRTPLVRAERLSQLTGCELYLKLESLQATGSFKDRGAFVKLSSLDAGQRKRGPHCVPRLLPKWGGRVPVKIRTVSHSFGQYSLTVFGSRPAKSLLFALRVVVEARNCPALIACVGAGNSGNHIIRTILNSLYRFVKFPPERNKSRRRTGEHVRG